MVSLLCHFKTANTSEKTAKNRQPCLPGQRSGFDMDGNRISRGGWSFSKACGMEGYCIERAFVLYWIEPNHSIYPSVLASDGASVLILDKNKKHAFSSPFYSPGILVLQSKRWSGCPAGRLDSLSQAQGIYTTRQHPFRSSTNCLVRQAFSADDRREKLPHHPAYSWASGRDFLGVRY